MTAVAPIVIGYNTNQDIAGQKQIASRLIGMKNKLQDETVVLAPNSTYFTTDAFNSYKTYREDNGQTITCVSLEPLGNPDADTIRNFLKSNYLDGFRRTLLIIGDEYLIPSKKCYDLNYHGHTYEMHSDFYYGDLEGNWDKNNDNRYGEFLNDAVDFLDPEFIVGRLPVTYIYESDAILNRIVEYEKDTASWKKNMLCAAGTIGEPGDASLVMYRIDKILSRRNYPVTTMTDKGFFKFIKPDIELNETSFRKAWKEGQYGLIYVISHGSPTVICYYRGNYDYPIFFDVWDVPDLNPDYPGVYISLGCNNLQQYWEGGDNLGKALIKNCTVAAVGSTTLTDPGYISGAWAESFFPRMYLLRNYNLGKAMHITKSIYYLLFLRFKRNYDLGFSLQTNLLAFTIYGDPLIKQY